MEISTKTTDMIEIVDTAALTETDALYVCIKTLMLAREGTIPGSRNFGLPQDFLDAPDSDISLNIFATELQEKVDEYFDDVDIAGVTGEFSHDGKLIATAKVERS